MKKLGLLTSLISCIAICTVGLAQALATPSSGGTSVRTNSVAKNPYRPGVLLRAPQQPKGVRVLSRQWLRCDKHGHHCRAIRGAVHLTYRARIADVGHVLRVRVVVAGSQGSTSATTAATPVIGLPLPVNTALPTVSGTAAEGQTLTGSAGTWQYEVHFTYQWQDCNASGANCVNISGATGTTYTLQASDVGDTIVFVVTAYNY